MADETRTITQPEHDRFRVALEGPAPDEDGCVRPVLHDGHLIHEGGKREAPLVHMVCWDDDGTCRVVHGGDVRHVGDPSRPVPLDMRHSTASPVSLDVAVKDVAHRLTVNTRLAEPIHHALQVQTPIQLRFVNPWEATSDYTVSVDVAGRRVLDLRVSGKTTITPKAAPPDGCDPVEPTPAPRVQTMTDLLGRTNTPR